MNVKKIISLIMLLFMLLPLGAQNSEGKQRYKIAACDWMMLKRQKIGSFQLMKELGGGMKAHGIKNQKNIVENYFFCHQ